MGAPRSLKTLGLGIAWATSACVKDCPTPAHQALRVRTVARTRAGVGQSLRKADGRLGSLRAHGLTACSPDTGCYDYRDSHSNCWSLTDFYRAIYAPVSRSFVEGQHMGSKLDLTRFGGHLMFTQEGDQDGEGKKAIYAGIPAANGGITSGGTPV